MNLFELDQEILNCLDEETGEVVDIEKLTALQIERAEKLENVALWIKNLESDAKQLKEERDSFNERYKSATNKAESLKKWLSDAVACTPFETSRAKVSFRKSVVTEVDESIISKEWCIEKTTYTPDKTAIKKALQSGKDIEGAFLTEKYNIQIK